MVYGCTMTLHDEQMPDDVTDDEAFMLDRHEPMGFYPTISDFFDAEGDFAENLASDEQDHVEQDPAYWAHYGFDVGDD